MDLGPLRRHPNFRLLYSAQFISFLGSMVTYVAVPYQMYRITGSSFAVGLLGAVQLGPLLLGAFWGGSLADTSDRRRLLLICHVGAGAGSAVLALNALRDHPSP